MRNSRNNLSYRSNLSHQHGFTLVETMLAAVLLSLLFLGAMSLYTEALRAATKSGAQLTANATAANGLQHVEQDVREAYSVILPLDSPTPSPAFGLDLGTGYAPSQFKVTFLDPATNINRTINTGLKLFYPSVKAAAVSKVYTSSGAVIAPPQYDLSAGGAVLYIYRADLPANPNTATPATPDPSQGDCLWASGTEGGTAINQCIARLSDSRSASGGISAANTLPDAVEFSRPTVTSNYLLIRLISSYYSPISSANSTLANQQASDGNRLVFSGECVFMRNLNPN